MDPDLVRGLATKLDTSAHALTVTINSMIASLDHSWLGHDADDFRSWWNTQHQPALQRAETSIAGLAKSARNKAAAQDGASKAVGIGAAAGAVAAAGATAGGAAHAGSTAPATTVPVPDAASYASVAGLHASSAAYAQGPPANGQVDRWGNAANNCTSWAAVRRVEMGLAAPPSANGQDMASELAIATSPSQVHVGSLVFIPGTTSNPSGHLMVVGQVVGTDPQHYVVSEMKWDAKGLDQHGHRSGPTIRRHLGKDGSRPHAHDLRFSPGIEVNETGRFA